MKDVREVGAVQATGTTQCVYCGWSNRWSIRWSILLGPAARPVGTSTEADRAVVNAVVRETVWRGGSWIPVDVCGFRQRFVQNSHVTP